MSPTKNAALLIVGHGSTENPDSSTPYFTHADAVRKLGIFKEVHCAFWKEEPSLREADYLIDSDEVYVVPDFISEGYFTQEVIPRELELTAATTHRHGKTYHYCMPVGVHRAMSSIISKRAHEVAPDVPENETTVFIVGHGTSLNKNSTQSIRDQVAFLTESGAGYASVQEAYMEEEPFIADWHTLATTPNVVVVPFFIADGLHSYQDIPVMLGFEKDEGLAASQKDVFRNNPYHLQNKTLYYSSAIGTGALIANVIIDLVEDFRQNGASPFNNLAATS